ncbi:hypothetical protein [Rhizobacter sp. OV335]|uniref:hypothetical protein n=1 Tax=Rhizobacter sp. OV335 TaxID=1500264 RepID=UPI00091D0A4F|nr:hypothetical protein [Rhizobacter sp. OV335]SHN23049.1 hypothetical protein SAMN02787076_04286 [Rhizobacter sp. OV335]
MPSLFSGVVLLFCLGLWITPAAAVTPLAALDLQELVVDARASADGKRFVVVSQHADGKGATLRILDATDPAQLRESGTLDLPSPAAMALSADGRNALFVVTGPPGNHQTAIDHEVIAVDLTTPIQPRVRWREHYLARNLVLAAQAGRFAYTRPGSGKPDEWETAVVSADDRHTLRVIAHDRYDAVSVLSPQGGFLARTSYGSLSLWDLDSPDDAREESSDGPGGRFARGCIHAVLDSGHIVVPDGRTRRIGIYAPGAGLPRVAALRVDSMPLGCRPLNDARSDSVLSFAGESGRVLDLGLPGTPSPGVRGEWQLPAGFSPRAAVGNVVLAARWKPAQLRLFRLDAVPLAPVDWRPLELAHQAALQDLRARMPTALFSRQWTALERLEEAGIAEAVSAPVAELPPRRAAAILNDYGFLLARTNRSSYRAQAALHRAIALDPGRALAHLNLADVLRADLGTFAGAGGDVGSRNKEIASHYRAYLAAGGPPTAASTSFLRDDPAGGIRETCPRIAAWANAGRLKELVSGVGVDVPWGTRRVDLLFSLQGTAHVPMIDVSDAVTDQVVTEEQLDIKSGLLNGEGGGDDLGLLTLDGRHHILHHRGLRQPIETFSMDGEQDGSDDCRFTMTTKETVGAQASEPQLCKALQDPDSVPDIDFDEKASVPPAALKERWPWTEIDGTAMLAFANAGRPVRVARLSMSSSAGAGCEATFYETLDDDATVLRPGPDRDLLMALQEAQADTRYPVTCGNQARFFEHRSRVYFETKPYAWPLQQAGDEYHRVATVRSGKVLDICRFRFTSTTTGRPSGMPR